MQRTGEPQTAQNDRNRHKVDNKFKEWKEKKRRKITTKFNLHLEDFKNFMFENFKLTETKVHFLMFWNELAMTSFSLNGQTRGKTSTDKNM